MARKGPSSSAPAPSAGQYTGVSSKYLRLEELRWLRNLFFASRRVVAGQYAGRHSSSMRGHSVEFSDYRQYMPGDELMDIDWKIYGRSDRLFIKLFEHQADMTVNLVVDASASMAYAGQDGRKYSKYDHACMMAAAIAFLTIKQQDKASLTLASGGVKASLRPHGSFKHCCDILRAMEEARPEGQANLPDTLKQVASITGRRGLLILFSDLLDDMEAIFDALSIFTHRGSEVIVFHVLHADELKLPDLQDTVFIDSETTRRVSLNVADVRRAYRRELDSFLAVCSSICKGRGIDYNLVGTNRSYTDALGEYLFQRASTK